MSVTTVFVASAIILSLPPQAEPCFRIHRDAVNQVVEATYLGTNAAKRELARGVSPRQSIATWQQLRESSALRLVTIPWGTALNAEQIMELRQLNRLSELEIGTAAISSEFVEFPDFNSVLGDLKSLERLVCCKCNLTDDELGFVGKLPKLRSLSFNAENYSAPEKGPFVTDRCADFLTQSRSLRCIEIHEAAHLTSRFVAILVAGLPSLEQLTLSGYDTIDEASLQALSKHSSLRELSLPDLRLSDEQFRTFRGQTKLRKLRVDGRDLSEPTIIEVLSSMTNLKKFEIGRNNSDLQQAIDQILEVR
jgi:Leucine-rich repeat (LRR) protein